MKRDGRTRAGELMNFAGIRKLLGDGGRRRGLHELAKPRACIRKAPRRQLDLKRIERAEDSFGFLRRETHSGTSACPGFKTCFAPFHTKSASIPVGTSMLAFPFFTATEMGPCGVGTVPDTSASPFRFGAIRTR